MEKKFTQNDFDQCVFKLATDKIHFHTVQFLEKGGRFGYQPVASGVLVKIHEKHLIFTASHVTAVADVKNLYINTGKGFVRVVGDSRETDLEKDKHTDLAYIILEDSVGKALEESYSFLPIFKIIANHQLTADIRYGVMGYPTKNIRTEGKTVYAGSSFFLLGGAKDKVYEFHKMDPARHHVLNFSGKGIDLEENEQAKVDPEPYGISGCGLWLFKPRVENGELICEYQLIGIMTQFRKVKFHVLIGNRVELIMSALRELEGFLIRPKQSI